jgi:hypothetical protein
VQAVEWWCPGVLCVPLSSEEGGLQLREICPARKWEGRSWPCATCGGSESGQWSKGMPVCEIGGHAAIGRGCDHARLTCAPTHPAPQPSVPVPFLAPGQSRENARGCVSGSLGWQMGGLPRHIQGTCGCLAIPVAHHTLMLSARPSSHALGPAWVLPGLAGVPVPVSWPEFSQAQFGAPRGMAEAA